MQGGKLALKDVNLLETNFHKHVSAKSYGNIFAENLALHVSYTRDLFNTAMSSAQSVATARVLGQIKKRLRFDMKVAGRYVRGQLVDLL